MPGDTYSPHKQIIDLVVYYRNSQLQKVLRIVNRPGSRIEEWVSRMDEFLSWGEQAIMDEWRPDGGMDEWGEDSGVH
jgi:hypothetical protein